MKILSIFVVVFLVAYPAFAQELQKQEADRIFSKYSIQSNSPFSASSAYYLVCPYTGVLNGSSLIHPFNSEVAIVEINSAEEFNRLKSVSKVEPANNEWKLSPSASRQQGQIKNGDKLILSSMSFDSLFLKLSALNSLVQIVSIDRPSHSIVVQLKSPSGGNLLKGLKEVIFLDLVLKAQPEIGIIGYDRSFHGINAVEYMIPGANGKNITVGVKEQRMEVNDLDLWKRVLPSPLAAATVSNHASVISSIIGGAGNSFYDGRGIAWGSKFFPSSFANLFPDDATVLNSNKVTVQNHSYGTIIQQFYGAEAVSYDAQTWMDKKLIHVFSSGNQGTAFATEGKYANIPGYANLTANFKMAKNIITVGAIDNKGNIPAESSAGPLFDGRIAPQLIALGPNGTSDAAAIVSGTVAVMQQVYADSNSQALPAASLVKSVLYNTAEDVYNPGIDYKTGYGLVDSYNAIRSLQQKKYDSASVAQGQSWTKTLTVPSNAAQLKLTLSWTDTSAIVNTNKALVNDLDLELTSVSSGLVYQPWVLSSFASADSLAKTPVRKRDSLNTAEQVSVKLPPAGNYLVKVKGTSINNGSVPFHVAWNVDTLNTFYFTSPQHASDLNRQENPYLTIRWKTFVADTNQTGNLFISYDRGTNWQLIQGAYKFYKNQYQWLIKDTSSTGLFKMETGFGNFYSKEFIISPVIRPNLDFVCADSFRLSWNKHIYANAYRIWTLIDSPYLKNILTVTDSFVVLQRSNYPSKVYAIEPLLSNGLPAARSIAFDIEQQGVHCFYKTFNYNLLDQNQVKLILELSVTTYVDSVFFESVSASGQLLQTYGGSRVTNGVFIYNQFVDAMPPGIIYARARIKLKSGLSVYSDIISILTSGDRIIVFYPNPASRYTPIRTVFKQGLPLDAGIRFFDISGRLLKSYSSLSGPIDISSFPVGIIIYKVVDGNGGYLDSGKIMVH